MTVIMMNVPETRTYRKRERTGNVEDRRRAKDQNDVAAKRAEHHVGHDHDNHDANAQVATRQAIGVFGIGAKRASVFLDSTSEQPVPRVLYQAQLLAARSSTGCTPVIG